MSEDPRTQHDFVPIPGFREITGCDPYPWQERLFEQFLQGHVPDAADIPTGGGKTTIVLLHLLALAQGAPLPRRIAYVVDRRAVVDQTAEVLRGWIERIALQPEQRRTLDALAAFEADTPVRLSILRGGLADDGEWRLDPARPTVVVGTVDMVGSRVLFSGYGNGRSRRAMDAGLLGYDTAVYLDEAHLSPALAALLTAIEQLGRNDGQRGLRAMRLSATQRPSAAALRLDQRDHAHPDLKARLNARKRLFLECAYDRTAMRARIVERAASLSGSVLVYVHRVDDVKAISAQLAKTRPEAKARIAVLTGTLRGKERAELMQSEVWQAFRSGRPRTDQTCWLIATAAAEVGVDLDADHAVMDLRPLDAMTQRLGRVNRDGTGDAKVYVVLPFDELDKIAEDRDSAERKANEAREKAERVLSRANKTLTERQAKPKPNARQVAAAQKAIEEAARKLRNVEAEAAATLDAIKQIELLRTHDLLAAVTNASPLALRALPVDQVQAASAARVQTVPLHPETVQALSLTSEPVGLSIEEHLHGIEEKPTPDTYVLWRRDVPDLVRAAVKASEQAAAEVLALFPPRPAELARVSTREAERLITQALKRLQKDTDGATLPIILRDAHGRTRAIDASAPAELPLQALRYATLLLPLTAGGLRDGLPDANSKTAVEDVADDDSRTRILPGEPMPDWADQATQLRIPLTEDTDEPDQDGNEAEAPALVYLTRRLQPALSTEDGDIARLAAAPQTLADHSARVASAGERIATALGLEQHLIDALREAGERHDWGKALRLWQRAAYARGELMAKSTRGRFRPALLGGYRHEFGSLTQAERDDCDDLVLHLVAAHHGWARPGFPDPRQWGPELPHNLAEQAAQRAAERFSRLQSQLGPWQLAWLEALLKCADAWVSSGRDRLAGDPGPERNDA